MRLAHGSGRESRVRSDRKRGEKTGGGVDFSRWLFVPSSCFAIKRGMRAASGWWGYVSLWRQVGTDLHNSPSRTVNYYSPSTAKTR